jgi:hypothetical protein
MNYPLIDTIKNYPEFNSVSFNYAICGARYDYYMSLNKEPTYIDCINYGKIPICLLDIVIIYKGYVKYGFLIFFNNNIIKKNYIIILIILILLYNFLQL